VTLILDFGTRRDEWSASRTGRFIPAERGRRTHWISGWVGPRAGLLAVEKKNPSPRRESNPRTQNYLLTPCCRVLFENLNHSLSNNSLSLWNPKAHYHAYKSPPQDPILRQPNPVRHVPFPLLRSCQRICPGPRRFEIFRNMIDFYGEGLSAPRQNTKLEDHPLSVVRDCLFNIFAATLHIWSHPPSATWGCAMPWWRGT
jgi:hypothetical protein